MDETTTIDDTANETLDQRLGDQGRGTDLLEDELLVEEISIDGMCGVY